MEAISVFPASPLPPSDFQELTALNGPTRMIPGLGCEMKCPFQRSQWVEFALKFPMDYGLGFDEIPFWGALGLILEAKLGV